MNYFGWYPNEGVKPRTTIYRVESSSRPLKGTVAANVGTARRVRQTTRIEMSRRHTVAVIETYESSDPFFQHSFARVVGDERRTGASELGQKVVVQIVLRWPRIGIDHIEIG